MCEINVKKSLLEVVEKNNLEILKIDLIDSNEAYVRYHGGNRDMFPGKVYSTIEDLDFKVESFHMQEDVQGTVYCRDKDTKEPVWIVSYGDEDDSWWEVNRIPDFYKNNPQSYRVKPEFKYRPFKDIEECWSEMQKHQPFGWINKMEKGQIKGRSSIEIVREDGVVLRLENGSTMHFDFKNLTDISYCFSDGTPLGIREEV